MSRVVEISLAWIPWVVSPVYPIPQLLSCEGRNQGISIPWWRHQMETFSALLAPRHWPLCGEFTGHRWIPAQRPVTRSFDVSFDLCLNKRLSKQRWGWWLETPSSPLWRHCNECDWLNNHGLSRFEHWNTLCNLAWYSNLSILFI